jgi:hypothetical protein
MNDPNKKVTVKISKRLTSTQSTGSREQFDCINDAAAALMHAKSLITTGHNSKNYSAWFAGQVAAKNASTHQPVQTKAGLLINGV